MNNIEETIIAKTQQYSDTLSYRHALMRSVCLP